MCSHPLGHMCFLLEQWLRPSNISIDTLHVCITHTFTLLERRLFLLLYRKSHKFNSSAHLFFSLSRLSVIQRNIYRQAGNISLPPLARIAWIRFWGAFLHVRCFFFLSANTHFSIAKFRSKLPSHRWRWKCILNEELFISKAHEPINPTISNSKMALQLSAPIQRKPLAFYVMYNVCNASYANKSRNWR